MRMSCNGCRVLRKGCSEDCNIRPCLQWIKSPESQANATVFLAKFYGRAGLMNLIGNGPEHLRPAIFRSLLYEACGRIVNPIYGSVGLLWSGNWQLCQSAVEAVLKGAPIVQISSELAAVGPTPPLKAYDIRHVSKDENSAASQELRKVRTRTKFKRSGSGSGAQAGCSKTRNGSEEDATRLVRALSHESSVSHPAEAHGGETDSMVTLSDDGSVVANRVGTEPVPKFGKYEKSGGDDVELELTLGFGGAAAKNWSETCCKMEAGQA